MNLDLSGKRALVCGSSRGIGRAVAVVLAEAGASVTLFGRDAQALTRVERELDSRGGQVHGHLVADFSRPFDVFDALKPVSGVFHVLVNNTGGPPPGEAQSADPEAFVRAFEQHLVANQILVQAVLPGMKSSRYGRIINIVSTSVKQPIRNLGVSNTIRGAVASWAKTLATELGRYGITVNNVLPGATRTERLEQILENKASRSGKSLENVEVEELSAIPLGRFAEPEEIAFAVAFLASPAASYVTGINFPVDGGRTMSL